MSLPAETTPPATGQEGRERPPERIRMQDVRFAWRAGAPDIIAIEDLSVANGERLFIAGPSGSGKRTLLSILGGVLVPRSGNVEVIGNDLAAMSGWQRDRFRADHIGFVFQMFNLVPYLSVVDNVTLPCRFSRCRRERAETRSSSVDTDARRLLSKLEIDDSLLSCPVVELSIGQQQRVAVARALIGSPEIVIADEPTSALDEGTRERFLELLFAECEAEGTTLLFVSHDSRLARLFGRRIVLSEVNKVTVH